jgi:methanogenic corrinoid protein MtbC1
MPINRLSPQIISRECENAACLGLIHTSTEGEIHEYGVSLIQEVLTDNS